MKEYIYPAIFSQNDDGSYTVTYPDLPGCITEGKSLKDALAMSQKALTQWIEYLLDKKVELPTATSVYQVEVDPSHEFVNMVCADLKDNRAVKRTVSIPKWLDDQATAAGLSLSRILQDALKSRLKQA